MGIHQYKFIVDGNWVFSKHHPTANDANGNINNIIEITQKAEEIIRKKSQNEDVNSKNFDKQNGQENKKGSGYGLIYPMKETMNVDAVIIPDHFKGSYDINTHHKQFLIGNCEYLSKEGNNTNNYIGGNSSFISVRVPPHVNLYLFVYCFFNFNVFYFLFFYLKESFIN